MDDDRIDPAIERALERFRTAMDEAAKVPGKAERLQAAARAVADFIVAVDPASERMAGYLEGFVDTTVLAAKGRRE